MKTYKTHPWHGISIGEECPEIVTCFIEIVPTDTVKYEIDKTSGYLKIDRPQKFSNVPPALYGFIPKTYCGKRIGAYCDQKTNRTGIIGDGDPLDVLVLTEHGITHGDIIVKARPIGGLRMIDANEADDKIIAVLIGDAMYGKYQDISELPTAVIDRLRHYFLTYKLAPESVEKPRVEITHVYGKTEAQEVILESIADYGELD
jgi:inorganic pyrophosphatase